MNEEARVGREGSHPSLALVAPQVGETAPRRRRRGAIFFLAKAYYARECITDASPMSLTIDVISDVVCPWCYIGKRRLEAAAALDR